MNFSHKKSKARAVQHVMLHQVFKLQRDKSDAICTGLDSVNLTEFLLVNGVPIN